MITGLQRMTKYKYQQLVNLSPPKTYSKRIFNAFRDEYDEKYMFNIKLRDRFNKPTGGLWSSTYTPLADEDSKWIEWCKDNCQEDWVGKHSILLEIKSNARIFTIDSQDDLLNLYRLYPRVTFCDQKYIDYYEVQKDWDIIHLTEDGEWVCRHPRIYTGLNKNIELSLYGWDCESSLILNDVINRFKKIKTRR